MHLLIALLISASAPTRPALAQGSSSDAAALRAAGASSARALVYLASSARPVDAKSAQARC
jgi:hypothetical protein